MNKHIELYDVQPELAQQIEDFIIKSNDKKPIEEKITDLLQGWELLPEPKTEYYEPSGSLALGLSSNHFKLKNYQKSLEWALLAIEARREVPSGYTFLTAGVNYFELDDLDNAYKYFDLAYNEGKYNVFTNYDKKYWEFYKAEKENRKSKK